MAARKKKASKKTKIEVKQTPTGMMADVIRERAGKESHNDVGLWEDRIAIAEAVYAPYGDVFQKNLDFYVGQQWSQSEAVGATLEKRTLLTINRVLPILAAQNAQIMFRLPWWRVNSRIPEGADGAGPARAAEMALNYVMQHPANDMKAQARLGVLAAHLGYGAWKVTYTPDEGVDPEKDDEEVWGELIERVGVDPETGQEIPIRDILGGVPRINKDGGMTARGNKILLDTRDVTNFFKVDWVDWRDLRHDPEGGNNFLDHSWMSHRFSWRLDEFMENDLFTNKDGIEAAARMLTEKGLGNKPRRLQDGGINYGPNLRNSNLSGRITSDSDDMDLARLWGWQIWDFVDRRVKYIIDGHPYMVGNEPIPRWVGHSPYEFLKWHENLGEWYPYTEVEAIRPLIRSYNVLRSVQHDHRRRYVRRYEAQMDMIDEDELEKLKDPSDGTIILVKQMGKLSPIQDAPLDAQAYSDSEIDIRDTGEIAGSTPEARGTAQGETATQASIQERRGGARENDKRELLADALVKIGGKMLNAMQANLDSPLAVRIVGPSGEAWQSHVTRTDILGDFQLKIDISELEPNDVATERGQLLQLAQIFGPVAFQSPRFITRIARNFNMQDPQMVDELVAIFQALAEQQAAQAEAERGEGQRPGSPQPSQNTIEGGGGSEGRQAGRIARIG